jgi:phage terminase large subunit-like protein
MLTELQYRQKYRRIDWYQPHPKQLEFHNLHATECLLRAGNQLGKTTCVAAQMAFDALNFYPTWYRGIKHVRPSIERPHEFVGWAASVTSVMTRDGVQMKLLGDVGQKDGLGTGLIPLDNIVGFTNSRGISGFVDTVTLRRETGGSAIISLKTFEMDRQAFQGVSVDRVWLDEDVSRDNDTIFGECLARLAATNGRIYLSMTPLLGRSPIRRRFDEPGHPERAQVRMRLADALHIPGSEHQSIRNRYRASERATRADGEDLAVSGAVFEIPEELIKHSRDPATFPSYWRWLWGIDFSHGGLSASAHPFAAVLCCHDPDNDVLYVVHALKMNQALPIQHVAAMRAHPCFDAPVCWPHDGQQSGDAREGTTLASVYKGLGLRMLDKWSTFKDGGFSLEAGISEMESRMATGRLKVHFSLQDWFEEFRQYHRDNLKVVALEDDLLSATRQCVMMVRSARTLDDRSGDGMLFGRRRRGALMARGLTFADDF